MTHEKVTFFQPTKFQKSTKIPGMAKKLPKKGFWMQKTMRNPLVMISKLYLKPFGLKLRMYANYPQNCTSKNDPLPHFNTP